LYDIELVICALSSIFLKVHAFIVMSSLGEDVKNVIADVCYIASAKRNCRCLLR